MAGLFDFWGDSPNGQADLALAAGLLSGKGSFNQVLGGALMGGQGAYNSAIAAQQENAYKNAHAKLFGAQVTDMQAQEILRKAQAEDLVRKAKQQQALQGYMQGLALPATPPPGLGALRPEVYNDKLGTMPAAQSFDPKKFMALGGSAEDAKRIMEAEDLRMPNYTHVVTGSSAPGAPEQTFAVGKRGEKLDLGVVPRPQRPLVTVDLGKEKSYLQEVQQGMAKSDVAMYNEATTAAAANQSLARIKDIIAKTPATGGPGATLVVAARNLAAEYGMPINKAVDEANARLSAEFTSRIATQVLSGGRGISNDDRVALEQAFPSFRSGIPAEQLPSFIAQLEAINNAKMTAWQRRYDTLTPESRKEFPNTLGQYRRDPLDTGWDAAKEKRYQEWKARQQ